jgi:tetratricopeptide (TPR) repeat protein
LMEVARKETTKGRMLAELALPLLDAAAAGDPRDGAAWEAKAMALVLVGRSTAGLEACAASLKEDPDREMTLFLAASLALQLQRPTEVQTYAERAIRVNPWLWQVRQMLAEAYAQQGQWKKAIDAGRQAIQLQPANVPGRQLLIRCYLQLGDPLLAQVELKSCLSLMPEAQRDEFRRWVEQQMR